MSGLHIQVVPVAALAYQPDGPTRGHAHVGLPGHPTTERGRLDFGPLRLVALGELYPGEVVEMHRHANVENVLLMKSGQLHHRDTFGCSEVIGKSGMVAMSAGRGVEHSEHVLGEETVRALVIWIDPREHDISPRLHIAHAPRQERRDSLELLVSGRSGHAAVLGMGCDASISGAVVSCGMRVTYPVESGRAAYLLALDGPVRIDGQRVEPNERVLVEGTGNLEIEALDETEVILIDVPSGCRAR